MLTTAQTFRLSLRSRVEHWMHRLAELAAEAAAAPTPRDALRTLSELHAELHAFERRQVAYALADGVSFASIARDLGVSRQAVHRRFRGVADEELPLLLAPDAQRVLRYAREEAADELGGEHVLLGVLRAGDVPAAALLRDSGVSLDRARTQVEGASRHGKLFRSAASTPDPYSLLAAPAREARARGGHRIEVEHVLLGIMEDPTGGACRTLRALGADPAVLRGALLARVAP